MTYDENYLRNLTEKKLKALWLDAHIEYDKRKMVATLSFVMAVMLGFLTCILIVAHVWLLVTNGTIPSLVTFVTLGLLSFASVVVIPSLKQRQLEDHIQRINCALASKKVRTSAQGEDAQP